MLEAVSTEDAYRVDPPGSTKRKREMDEPSGLDSSTTSPRRKRQSLRISIPSLDTPVVQDTTPTHGDDSESTPTSGLSDPDSLFDEPTTLASPILANTSDHPNPALLTAPPIPGLFFTPSLRIPKHMEDEVMRFCIDTYFKTDGVNQVMLFGRFIESTSSTPGPPFSSSSSGLPPILIQLLRMLETVLLPVLPSSTYDLLFPSVPTMARQAIVNLYQPGEGISPHVDLLGRYGDGIIGVSFGSGCAMQFARSKAVQQSLEHNTETRDIWDVYLPERSVIVLSKDARYGWTHGINKRKDDYVTISDSDIGGRWIERGVRLSVTFRWLLPGADIVGGSNEHCSVAV